jgi:hypothetical protein
MMHLPSTRNSVLLLAVVCASTFGMHHGAMAQGFPLTCQGPFNPGFVFTVPFNWSSEGTATREPGQGECAWADRGPRGAEIQTKPPAPPGNVLCLPGPSSTGFSFFNIKAGEFYVFCAFTNPQEVAGHFSCLNVGNTVLAPQSMKPPLPSKPICPQ